jgi:hypothetical protein
VLARQSEVAHHRPIGSSTVVVMRPVMLLAVRRAVSHGSKWLLYVLALLDKSIRENKKIRRAA